MKEEIKFPPHLAGIMENFNPDIKEVVLMKGTATGATCEISENAIGYYVTDEKQRTNVKSWRKDNLPHLREYKKNYISNNEHNRIRNLLSVKIRQMILGVCKTDLSDLTGCTNEEFKSHLESKFVGGMSWENYGKYGWHIDHIMACAKFDLTKEKDVKKCFHYSNLQPLWHNDNYRKFNK